MTSIETQVLQPYKYGFVTDIESDNVPAGLNEDIIRLISAKKGEPAFMLEWRLKAFRHWLTMKEPTWANVKYPPIDYQAIVYYAAPRQAKSLDSLEQVDPKLIETFEKLGIPLSEQKRLSGVAVDAVFDSVSVATTFKETLAKQGIIFCSVLGGGARASRRWSSSTSARWYPTNDNFFAALNSAVFTDGSFAYIPKGVRCPLELSTYFRINAAATGQFERTLIIADEGSYVSYLEGCSAPMRDENQLHAAVVELVALDDAQIKYSTVQNWYPGDEEGRGGIYNFVTKRGKCAGRNSKISWTQVETGSAITWKYPGCILQGDNSIGEFYSVAVTNNRQQADTGTKMIHIGKNTRSTIVSKGISAGHGQNTYRGLVKILKGATGARNYSQCDSMLIGDRVRCAHLPVHRRAQQHGDHGARSVHVEDRRGPDLLLPAARPLGGGRGEHDRERLLQGSLPRAADGVRRRSAAPARHQPRRQRRMTPVTGTPMLEIKNLHASVEGKEILRGIDLTVNAGEVHAIMGPNGSGKSTLAQVLAGHPAYAVTEGAIRYEGKDLLELAPEERAREGIFLAFQYPVAIRGITNAYFLRSALNAIRKHRGLARAGPDRVHRSPGREAQAPSSRTTA